MSFDVETYWESMAGEYLKELEGDQDERVRRWQFYNRNLTESSTDDETELQRAYLNQINNMRPVHEAGENRRRPRRRVRIRARRRGIGVRERREEPLAINREALNLIFDNMEVLINQLFTMLRLL
jgi:hypothetical protein